MFQHDVYREAGKHWAESAEKWEWTHYPEGCAGLEETTTAGDIFRDRWDGARRKKRGFGCTFGGALEGLSGQGGISRARGAEIAVRRRGWLQGQVLGSPIPGRRRAASVASMNRSSQIANRSGHCIPRGLCPEYSPAM